MKKHYMLLSGLLLLGVFPIKAQLITTIAGNGTAGYSGDGGAATAAEVNLPSGVACDASGNIYIADTPNNRIRKVSTSGAISTIAGNGVAGYSGDGGAATAAEINTPHGMTVDRYGNIYVADGSNERIRKINTSGVISTFAGNGILGFGGDGGPATVAEFRTPSEITFDSYGNAYITDPGNERIRKVSASGTINTYAGIGSASYSGDGGQATAAALNDPVDVFADAYGNTYIADKNNNRIRKVNHWGVISTFAGNGTASYSGDGGAATAAEINAITGVRADAYGNVYIADYGNNRMRIVSTSGTINTIGGDGTRGYSGDGGEATAAELYNPGMMTFDKNGNLYFIDHSNNVIRVIYLSLKVSVSITSNDSCNGSSNGSASATASQGTTPYTYSWSAGAGTGSTATGLSAGTYTITVTDNNDITGWAKVTITQPGVVPTPTIVTYSTDSIKFKVLSPVDTLTYSWALDDITGHYDGIGDTVYLPAWPRNAKLTFYAQAPTTGCIAQSSINIAHNFPLPLWQQPYPRWSKRGIYLEYANNMIDTTYTTSTNLVTPFITFCRNNHITYVCMDGLEYDAGDPGSVFGISDKWVDPANAANLMSFIDSMKTRGGVEEVGVICYDTAMAKDSMAANIDYFNEHDNIGYYNLGLPWQEKIDVLSLDDEFWNEWPRRSISSTDYAAQYAWTVNEFHTVHMPMLKAMYNVAHECPEGYLRVEDFIATPLDPWAAYCCSTNTVTCCNNYDTDLYHLNYYTKMEVDSIALYTDRLLIGSYTGYPTVLWNESDFTQLDSEIATNPSGAYYKKEIWPVFSDENSSYSACAVCAYKNGDNFSGADLCDSGKLDTAEYIEQLYFDSLSYSENHLPTPIFTDIDNNGNFSHTDMGADTDFQVLGDMWFDYACMNQQGIKFDTLTNGPHQGYLRFYVTLGPDIQWLHISVPPPITVTATIHGGKGPYTYTWYDIKTGIPLYNGSSNTYIATWSDSSGTYNVNQLGVVVADAIHTPGHDTTVTDYMNIYQYCDQPLYFGPVKKTHTVTDSILTGVNNVKIFPNPNQGQFTVQITSTDESAKILEIYSMMGEQVFKEPLLNPVGNNTINLNTDASGLYFYRVLNETGKLTGSGKLIIEK